MSHRICTLSESSGVLQVGHVLFIAQRKQKAHTPVICMFTPKLDAPAHTVSHFQV